MLTIKTHEHLHINMNEYMFSFTFLCNFHASVKLCYFYSDFHEMFTKMQNEEIGNDIHHFGKFLLSFELRRGLYLAPNQA